MKGLMIASMILLLGVFGFTQDAGFESSRPVLKRNDFRLFNERDYISISDYELGYSDLKLTELWISEPKAHGIEMSTRLRSLQKCGSPTPMFYKDRNVGFLYWCSQENSRVLLYSYGEKIYMISAVSEDIINRFTKAILPLACHVHGSRDCVSMFY